MTNQVIHGDCMDVMREMKANSIDTIITDPPYHLGSISKRFTKTSLGDDNDTAANARNGSNQYARLSTGFMGKTWDGGGIAFQPELWAEMLRVAKPGATLMAFGGTRTHHRLMVAIEDAGWEIRDVIMYLFGSGFPKSHNISKAIDKATITDCANCNGKGFVTSELPPYENLVAEDPDNHITYEDWLYFQTPEGIIARQYKCADCNGTGKAKGKDGTYGEPKSPAHAGWIERGRMRGDNGHEGLQRPWMQDKEAVERNAREYIPATDAAATWEGFGTGLKPAYEPIIYAQKPIDGTYANNAIVHGVAGLNIDGGRIALTPENVAKHHLNRTYKIKSKFSAGNNQMAGWGLNKENREVELYNPKGRWPANVLLSHAEGCVRRGEKRVRGERIGHRGNGGMWGNLPADKSGGHDYADPNGLETVADWSCVEGCPIRILDEQAGVRKTGGPGITKESYDAVTYGKQRTRQTISYGDSGSASRFFYTSKAPNREKWFYCQLCAQAYPNKERDDHAHGIDQGQRKHIVAHPTVKPLSILNYLCTLTKTPAAGIVLDPFAGSGTTGLACLETGRDFILIEKESDYYEIAKARVADEMSQPRQAELW